MTTVQRFDLSEFKATKTDEGFLYDSPVVARTGIQLYTKADGGIRRELRLPEEVFHPDALASMKGKPITVDHPAEGRVTGKNVHRHGVGTMISEGRQDGETVVSDIVIHASDTIGDRRQLSLGYTAHLDETPGVWNGLEYDAIQRTIRVNHLSVVKQARAGAIARLNLDSNDNQSIGLDEDELKMKKIKLDNGIEYDAAPEVAVAIEKFKSDAVAAQASIDKANAERDTLKARVDTFDAELKKAKEAGFVEAQERSKLDAIAAQFKVDAKDKTPRQIKELVILSERKDAQLADKSEAYIDAAFDLALEAKNKKGIADQRQRVNNNDGNDDNRYIPASEKQLNFVHSRTQSKEAH